MFRMNWIVYYVILEWIAKEMEDLGYEYRWPYQHKELDSEGIVINNS